MRTDNFFCCVLHLYAKEQTLKEMPCAITDDLKRQIKLQENRASAFMEAMPDFYFGENQKNGTGKAKYGSPIFLNLCCIFDIAPKKAYEIKQMPHIIRFYSF